MEDLEKPSSSFNSIKPFNLRRINSLANLFHNFSKLSYQKLKIFMLFKVLIVYFC